MRVIVSGGRDLVWTSKHRNWLIGTLKDLNATVVVCGMCSGADELGYDVAKQLGLKIDEHPALWGKYGLSAGPIRNGEMADVADALILFPGGKGTRNMERHALEKGLNPIIKFAQ